MHYSDLIYNELFFILQYELSSNAARFCWSDFYRLHTKLFLSFLFEKFSDSQG